MPGIPSEVVEKVVEANDIVEVIQDYLSLQRAGNEFRALCPFHNERTPSFTVSPSSQLYYCFGCQRGGTVVQFVMEYENIAFPAAIRKLAERAGIPIPEDESSPHERRDQALRARLKALHTDAADWYHRRLLSRETDAEEARNYLKKRGFNREIAQHWKIGYAPESWDFLLSHAEEVGYSAELLLASGLVKSRQEGDPRSGLFDRFRDRIMFPICDEFGQVVAFSGRRLRDGDNEAPKYLNSPETPLFIKGRILFGYHQSKRDIIKAERAIVLEGQIDLISAFHAGVRNVVAPQGTAFTADQARILKRSAQEVVLCFDSDTAGQGAAEKSLPALFQNDFTVKVAELPAGHDPDSLIREQGAEAFQAAIEQSRSFFEVALERLVKGSHGSMDPNQALAAARKLCGLAAQIREPVLRDPVVEDIAIRLQLNEADVQRFMREAVQKARREETRGSARGLSGPGKAVSAEAAEYPEEAEPVRGELSEEVKWICEAAMRHLACREHLRAKPDWREVLGQLKDGDLMIKLVEADFDPAEERQTRAFLSTLPARDAEVILTILHEQKEESLDGALNRVRTAWVNFQRRRVENRIAALKHQQKKMGLALEKQMSLGKEIVDLQKVLADIARLSG